MDTAPDRLTLIIVSLAFAATLLAQQVGLLAFLEAETLSLRLVARNATSGPAVTAPHQDIVIVSLDEAFYDTYDKFPLTRADLATLVKRAGELGAGAIGVDMILDYNSAYGEDPLLAEAFAATGEVTLVSLAELDNSGKFTGLTLPIPQFADVTQQGYSNINSLSVIRESVAQLRVLPDAAAMDIWPFSVELVAGFLEVRPELLGRTLALGDNRMVSLDRGSSFYIDYPAPQIVGNATLPLHDAIGFSGLDLLFLPEDELQDFRTLFEGKLVLIGDTSELALDSHITPIGTLYGVEIIAAQVNTLLKGGPIRPAPFVADLLCLALLMALVALSSSMSNPLPRYTTMAAGLLAFIGIVFTAFIFGGTVLALAYPLTGSVIAFAAININHYQQERESRRQIRQTFSQFLAPAVVEDLERNPQKIKLGGEERELTVLFSDLASFSSFSEQLTPTQLVEFLNEYLTAMSEIIIGNRGTIDKYEGDAILCFWGAPIPQEDHASLACRTAVQMQLALARLREHWMEQGYPELHQRIGINSGNMVVGNMGSDLRMDYTVMGDAVNLGSRIEGVNKAYGSEIMITQDTVDRLDQEFCYRELDWIIVMGRNTPTTVYELHSIEGAAPSNLAERNQLFAEGLSHYRGQRFEVAKEHFSACLEISKADGPAKVFFARCEAFIAHPPAANWDGVTRLDSK